ncbi:MAG: ribonuclease P protein component [Pseudomonadota bacterium]
MDAARYPKRARLLKAAQFDAAFKQGKRINAGVFTAVIASNDQGFARLGFALSKKHAPHAVHRNRVRRLLRERFRLHQKGLAPVDLVLMLRGRLPTDAMALKTEADTIWKQVLARCKTP